MSKVAEALDGLYPAVVTSNQDPLKLGRIRVVFPWLHDTTESFWARMVQPYAGKQRGMFFLPEVGDEVVVVFELGDVHQPLVVGAAYNGKDEPPEPNDPDGSNHHKVIETRSGHKLHFDDTPGAEFIQLNDSSLNNFVRWDCATNKIQIVAKTGDIIIQAPQGKINLKAREIFMKASATASRNVGADESVDIADSGTEAADSSKTLTAGARLAVTVPNTTITASASMSMSGGSIGVQITDQTEGLEVEGPTNETTNELNVTSDTVLEKAAVRTWTTGQASLHGFVVAVDTTGPLTLSVGSFSGQFSQGDMSLLGANVSVMGGIVTLSGGMVEMNPSTPPTPGTPQRAPIQQKGG